MIKFDGIGNGDIKNIQEVQNMFIELSPTGDDEMNYDKDFKHRDSKINELMDENDTYRTQNMRLERELKQAREEASRWRAIAEERDQSSKRSSRVDTAMISQLKSQLEELDAKLAKTSQKYTEPEFDQSTFVYDPIHENCRVAGKLGDLFQYGSSHPYLSDSARRKVLRMQTKKRLDTKKRMQQKRSPSKETKYEMFPYNTVDRLYERNGVEGHLRRRADMNVDINYDRFITTPMANISKSVAQRTNNMYFQPSLLAQTKEGGLVLDIVAEYVSAAPNGEGNKLDLKVIDEIEDFQHNVWQMSMIDVMAEYLRLSCIVKGSTKLFNIVCCEECMIYINKCGYLDNKQNEDIRNSDINISQIHADCMEIHLSNSLMSTPYAHLMIHGFLASLGSPNLFITRRDSLKFCSRFVISVAIYPTAEQTLEFSWLLHYRKQMLVLLPQKQVKCTGQLLQSEPLRHFVSESGKHAVLNKGSLPLTKSNKRRRAVERVKPSPKRVVPAYSTPVVHTYNTVNTQISHPTLSYPASVSSTSSSTVTSSPIMNMNTATMKKKRSPPGLGGSVTPPRRADSPPSSCTTPQLHGQTQPSDESCYVVNQSRHNSNEGNVYEFIYPATYYIFVNSPVELPPFRIVLPTSGVAIQIKFKCQV
eukprot:UN34865